MIPAGFVPRNGAGPVPREVIHFVLELRGKEQQALNEKTAKLKRGVPPGRRSESAIVPMIAHYGED